MSSIRDRTGEFRATVEHHRPDPIVRKRSPTPTSLEPRKDIPGHSEFMSRAAVISKDIQSVCVHLERLTRLTKSRPALLDDHKAAELLEARTMVERSLHRINGSIGELKALQQQQRSGERGGHAAGVVVSLQSRLADASKTLQGMLQERERQEKEQWARREQYTAVPSVPANLAIPSVASRAERRMERAPLLNADASHHDTVIDIPQTRMNYQQLALIDSTDTSYLESRSQAVRGIEASINEVGQVFQQLAQMISEQGETVQRIDANMEDVAMNVGRGQAELTKYYNYISDNRWLMLKIFVVMLVFMFIFNAFFL